ncbi:growth hormone secretagogue receptor type 1 isoform X2 [Diorhabda sublineata]|uniref:growth hormone secretagogue receptor type 1 isoform X2 n=1 Tax=Diorhabda sublineata TaxID=1163346 RepID=UPI0024E0D9F0|nr:growth hormone secretagogue receptor type 1 isoform X2 [Diorhabda sublineata]
MISTTTSLSTTSVLNATPLSITDINATTSNYLYSPSALDVFNITNNVTNFTEGIYPVFPSYIRTTSMVFCIIIMCLGVIGNVMVPIVIFKTKDMRNSTNIFLVNLSVADLMVLLVCTPTVLVEVNSIPETWVLGREMCKAVPFVELTVAHASVLTILAISFERYYAICKPLKAGYICTKARASLICLLAWFVAAVFTSPILAITQYSTEKYIDGSLVFVCFSLVEDLFPCIFFIGSVVVFFIFPLGILICVYALIASSLMAQPLVMIASRNNTVPAQNVIKYRKQVILMLGTVVLAFFICLLPFRALTLWIIIAPAGSIIELGFERYYNILYFSRIMFHINSAVNPILYNIMSSKFRGGFFKLCGAKKFRQRYLKKPEITRKSTSSSTHTSSQQTSESFLKNSRNYSRQSSSLKEVKEEEDTSNKKNLVKNVYVRAPIEIVAGINGEKLPSGEIYV